jgi:TPR repeat protein
MSRAHQYWLSCVAVTAALSIATANAGDEPDRAQRMMRDATDSYAHGQLENAWFGFWTLARAGSPAAQFNLGQLYRQGQGIPTDLVQARLWYEAAAAQGYAFAQYNLGIMYEFGHGMSASPVEALAWYRRAAAQNLPEAQRALRRIEARDAGRAPVAALPAAATGDKPPQ